MTVQYQLNKKKLETGTHREKSNALYHFNKQRREIGKGNGIFYIIDMLKSCDIDFHEEDYSVEEYLPRLQNYLTDKYPDEGWGVCKNERFIF